VLYSTSSQATIRPRFKQAAFENDHVSVLCVVGTREQNYKRTRRDRVLIRLSDVYETCTEPNGQVCGTPYLGTARAERRNCTKMRCSCVYSLTTLCFCNRLVMRDPSIRTRQRDVAQ